MADPLRRSASHASERQLQYVLVEVGRALGYDAYVPRYHRNRTCQCQSLAPLTVAEPPRNGWSAEVLDTIV